MDNVQIHDEFAFENTITTIVVLSMLGTAIAYLYVVTTYIHGWYLIELTFRVALFTPFGLLVAGATYIIFRK
jgi:hypothetical protein